MDLENSITSMFGAIYEISPSIAGSKYWVFFFLSLVLIAVVDVLFFGWRPLVKHLAPDAYPLVDHIVVHVFNGIAAVGLLVITWTMCSELGTWWPAIIVVMIVAPMFGWRYVRDNMMT